jgi:DNA-binding response OmpR family regulator
LESKGYKIWTANNGQKAIEIFDKEKISLILLDLMLPDMSGEEICAVLRKKSRVPIIMLTAKVEEEDLIKGLKIGADDYIRKPFSLKELQARIETLLRRTDGDLTPLSAQYNFNDGDLIIDFDKNSIKKNGEEINLTPSELKILSFLIKYAGKVFSRQELIEKVFGDDFDAYDRAIDSHIKNLRKKIEDEPKNPVYVLTIHGLGYKFGGER